MESPKKELFFQETTRFALITLAIVLPIRLFIAEPFIVSGTSMQPTFENREYLIVDRLSYRFEEPKRGDVVIFRYPRDPSKYFIKRIIGLPGETIIISGNKITIKNDENSEGIVLDESHIVRQSPGNLTTKIGENEYFVMGDNRPSSSDSRIWGTLPEENIVGRAFLRLYPISRVSIFPGEHTY